jgi:hypothetical protein
MKGLAAKALLLVVSSACALGLAEVMVRVVYPQQLGVWYSLRSGMVIHPPSTRIHLANFGQTVEFNSLGMRDVEHRQPKPPGTFRILVLGDSFMEALQVPLEASFSRLLEDQLRRATGQRVEVVSCGVGGWGTDDQLEYLRRYGVRLEPDLIIVAMTLHNDVADNLRERFHTLADDQVVSRQHTEIPAVRFALLKIKDFLASRSHLTQLLRKFRSLGEIRQSAQQLDAHVLQLFQKEASTTMTRGWQLTAGLLRGVRVEGASVGARTTVVLIPLSVQIYDDVLRRWLVEAGLTLSDIELDRPQRVMHEFEARLGVDVIDLTPAFRATAKGGGRSLHVPGDGHWNREGHQVAATVVARELIGRRLIAGKAAATRP